MAYIRDVSVFGLVPKTEPTMAAAINTVVIKPMGMINRFLKYHGRLLSKLKLQMKHTERRKS